MGGNTGDYHPQNAKFTIGDFHMTAMEKCVVSCGESSPFWSPDLICDLTELGKIHHLSGRLGPPLVMMEKNHNMVEYKKEQNLGMDERWWKLWKLF